MNTSPLSSKRYALVRVIVLFMLCNHALAETTWSQIKTPHARLIFKQGMSQEAQRLANTLDHLYGPISQSLGARPAPISLILWDKNFQSNAQVAHFPRRMELYNVPFQEYGLLGTNEWFNLLAAHEFRHVVQHAKLRHNLLKGLYCFGGDITQVPVQYILVPKWVYEGDAVVTETVLTKSGRGRMPYFSRLYRMNLLEHGGFSYSKQMFRSLKHQVPDHYRMGYYLVAHLRRKYGAEVLEKILAKTTWLIPFPIAVWQVTGKSMTQVYKEANEELKALWQGQIDGLITTPATSMVNRDDETYTDYSYPQTNSKGEIVVLKSGLGTAKQFVLLHQKQQETPLFIPGTVHKNVSFTMAQGQIVWTEEVPHYGSDLDEYKEPIMWGQHYYGVIQRYDVQKKCLKTLTHQSRYKAAALSPDAQKIVAVETTSNYQHRLVILDAENGAVLRHLPNPNNYFYMTPRWLDDGQRVVVVKHYNSQATLALVDTHTGQSEDLLPYSEENIGVPVPCGKYVLYNSAYNGIDNIYALDLASGKRYQVTSRKYGAYHPTLSQDGQWLIFNDFTKHGMDVAKMPFDPQSWTPLEEVEDRTVHYYAPIVDQENNADVLDHIPSKTYAVAPCRPWQHTFNVHSWLYDTVSSGKPEVGINIHSKDLLDTTDLQIGYIHNLYKGKSTGSIMGSMASTSFDALNPWTETSIQNSIGRFGKILRNDVSNIDKHTKTGFLKLVYRGFYPVFAFEGELEALPKAACLNKSLAIDVKLPLTVKRGQYMHYAALSFKNAIKEEATRNKGADFIDKIWERTYQFHVSRYGSTLAPRDLTKRWKQALTVSYTQTPYYESEAIKSAEQVWRIIPHFFLPGPFKHHTLEVKPSLLLQKYQADTKRSPQGLFDKLSHKLGKNTYWYLINRGLMQHGRTLEAFKVAFMGLVIEATYRWPIAYPELDLGGGLYMQQISGRICYKSVCKEWKWNAFYTPSAKKSWHSDEGQELFQIGPAIDMGIPLIGLSFRVEPMFTYDLDKGLGWDFKLGTEHKLF